MITENDIKHLGGIVNEKTNTYWRAANQATLLREALKEAEAWLQEAITAEKNAKDRYANACIEMQKQSK